MNDPRLISRICYMYYMKKLSKIEIAERLRLSRFQVARIIDNALDEGYVTFQVLEPEPLYPKLADELEKSFGLKIVIIVDNAGLNGFELKRRVAIAAGRHLLEILRDRDVLGVSLGTTIQAMVESLPATLDKKISIVQLLGGGSVTSTEASCDSLTLELAKKTRSKPYFLYAPAFVDSPELKKALLTDGSIQATYAKYKTLSIAVVGIGAIGDQPSSMLVNNGVITQEMLTEIIQMGIVGDVLAYLYDKNGAVQQSGLEDRTLAIPLEDYLSTPYRLGVATGIEKVQAIMGALQGKLVNALVTDNLTAMSILDLFKSQNTSDNLIVESHLN